MKMRIYLDTYQQIENMLIQEFDVLRQYSIKYEELEKEYHSKLHRGEQMWNTGLNQITEYQNVVNTYLRIARAHTSQEINPQNSQPYNKDILSRLSVQIDMNSNEDMAARKLLEVAKCQLLGLNQEIQKANRNYNQIRENLEKEFNRNKSTIYQERNRVKERIRCYIQSAEFYSFAGNIYERHWAFLESKATERMLADGFVSIGGLYYKLTIPEEIDDSPIINMFRGFYREDIKQVGLPLLINVVRGGVHYLEYDSDSEKNMLSGIQMLILNIARYFNEFCEHICYIDPIRMNGSALGCIQQLTHGMNPYIDEIPINKQGIIKMLIKAIEVLNGISENRTNQEMPIDYFKRIFIFHDFPQGYDLEAIDIIKRLCVNAKHYGIKIILTHNVLEKDIQGNKIIDFILPITDGQVFRDNSYFYVNSDNTKKIFSWYAAPDSLPEDIKKRFIIERSEKIMSNDYDFRIGLKDIPAYKKGNRSLSNIPIGIDQEGNVVNIDLENSNFATFICGAARSGKSTLLHTIITNIIKNIHPDDVEVWLIDFKMTEFSRYINHLPPHLRYIILDESPELVYDLIDRLSDILQKRQNMFKGKLQKLSDVPTEKYMPAILVIIDEFSIMSGIIKDSVNSSVDYRGKMQALLAKGAALGFHFIFASQGFTDGTNGLTDFTKKQIQQRIAMKTDFYEIKETLDLRSISDEDHFQMEQLPVHHALLRIPVNDKGNHLNLLKVLYISNYNDQESLIDTIGRNISVESKYNVLDNHTYIYKRPMIFNGNEYNTFLDKQQAMNNKYSDYLNEYGEGMLLFIGEPRRMLSVCPIEIMDSHGENIILIAPTWEKMPAVSLLLSIFESLKMQNKNTVIWTTKRNPLYRQMYQGCKINETVFCDMEEICNQIAALKKVIQEEQEDDCFYVLLGFETLLTDMEYLIQSNYKSKREDLIRTAMNIEVSWNIPKKNNNATPDILQQIAAKKEHPLDKETVTQKGQEQSINRELHIASDHIKENSNEFSAIPKSCVYDARDDLKFILTHGPRLGYHFMMVFNTVGEIEKNRIDMSLFRHKILFKTARGEATSLVGSTFSKVVAELDDHCYRYINGLDAVSFRPYLHQGLTWDGWTLDLDGKAVFTRTEEEYLL